MTKTYREYLSRYDIDREYSCLPFAILKGLTKLHHLILVGAPASIISEYLDDHQEVNATNEDGITPLMLSSIFSHSRSSLAVMRVLLDRGAIVDQRDVEGMTALMLVSKFSNIECHPDAIGLLIEYGAAMNAINGDGETVLMCAIMCLDSTSDMETVKKLMRLGACLDPRGKYVPILMDSSDLEKSEWIKIC